MAGDPTHLRVGDMLRLLICLLLSEVGVRRGGLTSPFEHKYEDPMSRVRASPSTTLRTHMFYLDIWKERKGKRARCKNRNGPEPYSCGREAVQMDDHTIGCLYLAVIVQHVISHMLWFVIPISFATNSLVFCSSVLPSCGKYWLKIYNLDQRIPTEDQQQCIKNDNSIH